MRLLLLLGCLLLTEIIDQVTSQGKSHITCMHYNVDLLDVLPVKGQISSRILKHLKKSLLKKQQLYSNTVCEICWLRTL